jgi:hypothetical protein
MTYPVYAGNTLAPPPPAPPTEEAFHSAPTGSWPIPGTAPAQPPQLPTKRSRLRKPLSILLIFVIVLVFAAAGLLGAEFYARMVAVEKVQAAAACFIEDSEDTVDVEFGTSPPVLMQYMNDKYSGFRITTHGTHIRSAQGMTAIIAVDDLDLNGDANKRGTIGAIDATINWTAEGMRESVNIALQEAIDEYIGDSFFSFVQDWIPTDQVVTSVKTDPSTGVVTAEGLLGTTISVKPEATADGGIQLAIQPDSFTLGGGLDLPQDDLQEKLDEMTGKLTDNKFNIRTDSLEVLDDGVVAKFSANNVDIPAGDGEGGGCASL